MYGAQVGRDGTMGSAMPESQLTNPSPAPEAFYRLILERAPLAIIATDARFRIVAWSRPAGELLGPKAEEMRGRPILDVVPEAHRQQLARLLERTSAEQEPSELHLRATVGKGQEKDLLLLLSPLVAAGGRPQGVAAWILDQTGRTELGDRLREAEKMASLGTLAGGIAHHFNNILGGVATFVDYALACEDPASMRRALQMTAEAASRVSKITRSLLSFAKCDLKGGDLADLTEVVLTFVHLVERPLAEKGIEVRLDLHPVPMFAVDANRMHQVLGNLLTNTEEAMPDGGTLSIALESRDGQIVLHFDDDGPGIQPEHLPLVFEPFFTTKGLLAGGDRANPGLGLSVAHGIVTEMGGKITVSSRPGEGTRFTITFPIPQDGEDSRRDA